MTRSEMGTIVAEEIGAIESKEQRAHLARLLIPPRRLELEWDYGRTPESRECWSVATSPDGRLQVVFCEPGFGNDRWGVIGIDEAGMGTDGQWFTRFYDAMVAMGSITAPPGYEVP